MASRTKKEAGQKTRQPQELKRAGMGGWPNRSVLYLYGVSEPARRNLPSSLTGVDGVSAVESLAHAGLCAWFSRVDAGEYGASLNEKLENLDWLASASVRHQKAVGEINSRGAILPARFGTVFTSEASLTSHIDENADAFRERLERVRDAEEWGVKVYRRGTGAAAQAPSAASGRDYLKQKAQMNRPAAKAGELAADIVAFGRELQQIARASAPAGKVSSGQKDLEWQASFLVPRSRREEWERVMRRYATDWQASREIELSGPWPPYSFVS